MAMTALTLFFVTAVLSVIFLFMLIILWKQQKQNNYLQTKLFLSTMAVSCFSFGAFWVMADNTEETSIEPTKSFDSVDEAVPDILERENNLKEYDYGPPVIETEILEEDGVIKASLTAKDNVTTDLIRSALLKTSTAIFDELFEFEEVSSIQLHWFFPTEEDGEPEKIVSITGEDKSLNWSGLSEDEIREQASDYWEHKNLD